MKEIIVITGPTASGKSALALHIARLLGSEIISADSRQIFRGLPIVTAQPSPEDLASVRHHLVGTLPLEAYYSASEFERDALAIIDRLHSEDRIPVVCGGSMMYVDALCKGLDDLPTVRDDIRQGLMKEWKVKGDNWLLNELKRIDSDYYEKVDRSNLKRVFHALEISRQAGVPYSSLLGKTKTQRSFRIRKFAIERPREELFDRINRRVESMIEEGAVEEVMKVKHLRNLNSLNTVGVKEILQYLDGHMNLDRAVARLQKNTRVYAKKQITWLKRDESVVWGDYDFIIDKLSDVLSAQGL